MLAFLAKTGWVLDIRDVLQRPAEYDGLSLPADIANARDAWLIVPLMTAQDLVGFVVLTTPRVNVELDWEVLDLLKTAGRQAAGYVAYTQATEALLEAQKFDAFHRMSTFVVHDLKNLIAQLQLLLSNAERHRDNPDFQRDMMKTIEHVVGRMHQLTLQLRPEASGRDSAQPVDVGMIVKRVQSLRLGGRSGLTVEVPEGAYAWAHEDLLERVIAHLVQNGFDASEGEQEVRVRVEREGDEVLVEVADRGKGMTPEFMRERLFRALPDDEGNRHGDRCVRVPAVRSADRRPHRRAERAGRRHRGSRSSARRRAGPHGVGGRGMTDARRSLLVVEDDPALQTQMKWAFDAYEVAVASDREEAIAQVRRLEPAVVTLDLGLPPEPGTAAEGFRTLENDSRAGARHEGHRGDRPARQRQRAARRRARRLRLLRQALRRRRSFR